MDQVEYMLGKMYSSEALHQQMQEEQVFYLILFGNQEVGFVAVSLKSDCELFLHKFYIDDSMQGKGVGATVFQFILDAYPQITTVRLTVNRQNYRSINFYFKLGFRIDQVADFDIGDGYVMNDFVMVYRRP
ncbi:MAG: GNAT family N-acetyltransferase [Flavobacteriales bacterium]